MGRKKPKNKIIFVFFSDEELSNCDSELKERLWPKQAMPAAIPQQVNDATAGGSQAASRKSSAEVSINTKKFGGKKSIN
jgi:hypothetical protein